MQSLIGPLGLLALATLAVAGRQDARTDPDIPADRLPHPLPLVVPAGLEVAFEKSLDI